MRAGLTNRYPTVPRWGFSRLVWGIIRFAQSSDTFTCATSRGNKRAGGFGHVSPPVSAAAAGVHPPAAVLLLDFVTRPTRITRVLIGPGDYPCMAVVDGFGAEKIIVRTEITAALLRLLVNLRAARSVELVTRPEFANNGGFGIPAMRG